MLSASEAAIYAYVSGALRLSGEQHATVAVMVRAVGRRSGFFYWGDQWLVAEQPYGQQTLSLDEFFQEVWHKELSAGVGLGATVGGLLTVDFTGLPTALAPPEGPDVTESFSNSMEAMRVRVHVANAFALAVHGATLDVLNTAMGGARVTHEDMIHFADSHEGFTQGGNVNLPLIPGVGCLVPQRRFGVLPEAVLERASEIVDEVLGNGDSALLDFANLLNQSLVACEGHDFDLAVVTAWTVCERVLSREFRSYAETQAAEHVLTVNRRRRNDWDRLNAATVVEVLALAGKVPADVETRIHAVRQKRNAWIHGGETPEYSTAVDALVLASDLVERFVGVRLRATPRIGVTGLGI